MTQIKITKPIQRWLFGGIGFHNSEATMTPVMSEEFLNERVLKSFAEISPTFSRVFGGYADWTKEAMDRFADYYDKTFRKSGTIIYLVPGRMPYVTKDFDVEEHAEKIAKNLDYLINVRDCKKIRYFCITNELSAGNRYAWLKGRMELFTELHDALYRAFKRHGIDVGLIATDASGAENFQQIQWAVDNMDDITNTYCTHLYMNQFKPGDLRMYDWFKNLLGGAVATALKKEKRYMLGEFGLAAGWPQKAMISDFQYSETVTGSEGVCAIALAEMAIAVINSGTLSGVYWTMFDYPDPFLPEDGDTEDEKARYDVSRFSGHGMGIRYNKHGLIRWSDDERDYSSRASLYTLGYMAKLFRKNSRVLEVEDFNDKHLRCAAVTNADGSMSLVVINWDNSEKNVSFEIEHTFDKPLRKYECAADNIPYNKFGDLQDYSEVIAAHNGKLETVLKPKSVTFITTDYIERKPSPVTNMRTENGKLLWDKCKDEEHCYYRVYASDDKDFVPNYDNQIVSTVAEEIPIENENLYYKIMSVDKYGNV